LKEEDEMELLERAVRPTEISLTEKSLEYGQRFRAGVKNSRTANGFMPVSHEMSSTTIQKLRGSAAALT
jgi:hypothetical protein